MAWNQPGGQNNPWGRRPGNGSRLDQRVQEWQRRLESLLRPGGRGEGGGSLALTVALVALALWLASGFFQVKAAERGVIQRFGKLVDTRQQGWGWRWPWPIETITKVNVANVESTQYKSRVLTADINLVDVIFEVQYQRTDPIKVLFRGVRNPEEALQEVSESAIREIIGQSLLNDVLGKDRPQVTARTKDLIQRMLDFYNTGLTVTTVNLTNVQVPEAVIPSQRDANKALADQERFEREAQAYANGILPVAQGAAARMQQEAEAYKAQVIAIAEGQASRFTQLADQYAQAPEVMRRRLYLETIENVLGRSNKVLLDSRAGTGGGNILYLPLDKLMEQARSRDTETASDPSLRAPPEQETVTVDGRSRGER